MVKTPIQIRVDAYDLERWSAAAKQMGISLSEWIRRACNSVSVPVLTAENVRNLKKLKFEPVEPVEPVEPRAKRNKWENKYCPGHHVMGCEVCE